MEFDSLSKSGRKSTSITLASIRQRDMMLPPRQKSKVSTWEWMHAALNDSPTGRLTLVAIADFIMQHRHTLTSTIDQILSTVGQTASISPDFEKDGMTGRKFFIRLTGSERGTPRPDKTKTGRMLKAASVIAGPQQHRVKNAISKSARGIERYSEGGRTLGGPPTTASSLVTVSPSLATNQMTLPFNPYLSSTALPYPFLPSVPLDHLFSSTAFPITPVIDNFRNLISHIPTHGVDYSCILRAPPEDLEVLYKMQVDVGLLLE
ncbi:hypothetical protein FRB94_012339 [Tulasnella sp. JGI-2019a]|nr:hypothetical protein FRB94_012339 [Tulasnella sp. JGI-2019a]KAG9033608.1 hypothetical protein FRB95_014596 [Tulasnella sp. JGI-2019a]